MYIILLLIICILVFIYKNQKERFISGYPVEHKYDPIYDPYFWDGRPEEWNVPLYGEQWQM